MFWANTKSPNLNFIIDTKWNQLTLEYSYEPGTWVDKPKTEFQAHSYSTFHGNLNDLISATFKAF